MSSKSAVAGSPVPIYRDHFPTQTSLANLLAKPLGARGSGHGDSHHPGRSVRACFGAAQPVDPERCEPAARTFPRLSPRPRRIWARRLSRIIYGTRVALQVGVFSVLLGGIVGTSIGVCAGYFGGKLEAALMRLVDVLLSFPDLITGLLVMAVLGSGLIKLIIAIAITITPRFARIAYGQTLSLKEKEYVDAARALGQGNHIILIRHILPNIGGELVVLASLWTASAIRLEASLSFIGLGVPPPTPTWGQMIREGTVYLSSLPLLSLAPGAALLIVVFAFNLVGDGLRDVLDPRSKS